MKNTLIINRQLFSRFLIFFIGILLLNPAYAHIEREKLWGELNASGKLFNYEKWLYQLEAQSRNDLTVQHIETYQFKASTGYQFWPDVSLWLGGHWNTKNFIFGAPPESRLWEQLKWDPVKEGHFTFSSRSRLEQRKRQDQDVWAHRFRQRFTLKFPKKILGKYTPVIADEIFFNLTTPSWVVQNKFDQNRAFVGIDIPTSKHTFIEVCYLNQYVRTNTQNQMNHILYVAFMMVDAF